jgi:TRAP-type C4-dicarboxylate transport system substrate-binding protein
LGTLDQAPENIRVRAFDLGQISTVYNPGAYPRTYVSVLPFITENTLAQYVVTNELFKSDLVKQDFDDLNQKYLMNGMWARLQLMSVEPINNIADLGKYKLRAHGGAADALTALGITSYSVPWEEYAAAAERGVVDGGIQGTPADANDIGLGDVYNYWERFIWYYFPMTLVINQDAWDEIPADLQQLILYISDTYAIKADNIYHEQELIAEQALAAKGVQDIYWTAAELATLKADAGEPVAAKWVADQTAAGIANAQAILDFYKARLQYYSE